MVIVGQPKGPHKIALVVPLSSRRDREDIDIALQSWRSGGLAKPTVARVHRLAALVGNNILEMIGELDKQDANRLKQAMRQALDL